MHKVFGDKHKTYFCQLSDMYKYYAVWHSQYDLLDHVIVVASLWSI